jgi:hypothetical protein
MAPDHESTATVNRQNPNDAAALAIRRLLRTVRTTGTKEVVALTTQQQQLADAGELRRKELITATRLAARDFDQRQMTWSLSTKSGMKATSKNLICSRADSAFKRSSLELFRNRYFIAEAPPPPPVAITGKAGERKAAIVKPPWRLEDSIWAGRQFRGGEDRGFYDEDTIRRRAVTCDFRKGLAKGFLMKLLLKSEQHSPDPETQPEEADAFIAEVEEVFVANARMFFMMFDYFASLGPSDDIFHIHRIGYDRMCADCGLWVKGSKHCDIGHIDIIFVAVNASSETWKQKQALARGTSGQCFAKDHDDAKRLTRAELIQCLCRIAIARYMHTPKSAKTPHAGKTSVAEALEELFKKLRSHAGREVCQNSMIFRRENCYSEETDKALRAHETALRILFAKYSSGTGISKASTDQMKRGSCTLFTAGTDKMLSVGQWICLCNDLGFINEDLGMEGARLIFMWSRMRVIDEDDPQARQRIENLTFWGFLEAIIRVSQRKALPTDDEVAASGYADGGAFLLGLQRDNPSAYFDFLRKNAKQWWEPTRQPIHKKLSILLSLVMHTISKNFKRWKEDGSMERAEKSAAKQRRAASRGGALAPPRAAGEVSGPQSNEDGTLTEADLASLDASLDVQTKLLNQAAGAIQKFALGQLTRNNLRAVRMGMMNLMVRESRKGKGVELGSVEEAQAA